MNRQWIVETEFFGVQTNGEIDVIDITENVEHFISEIGLQEGNVTIFHPGSTASITTIEYERGLVEDLKEMINILIQKGIGYQHDLIDNNAHSHLRATLLRPSLVVPVVGHSLLLGKWQQIVLVDLDVRPRNRRVVMQAMGIKER
ncbi:MAG: YjbQ family protein [Methanobacteriota archaeon]|nr:MAG: YjbQ family protein [Euryarchaeota archaeon]